MDSTPPPFEQTLAKTLADLGDFSLVPRADRGYDYCLVAPDGSKTLIEVKAYKRVTPATAEAALRDLKRKCEVTGAEPVLYAAVISDRTAEIAVEQGVSWMDFAGNCRLVFPRQGIYVLRSGLRNPYGKTVSTNLNVFSPKSSRVVRVMLQDPIQGWQLNELAKHPDVRISPGLMSRIKKSLVADSYAVMHDGLLRLKHPEALLRDWVEHYRNVDQPRYAFYMRGELQDIENKVADWFTDCNVEHALSHLSAAWRLAPEVRYNVATFLVSNEAIRDDSLKKFREECGARRVESGANLMLQIPEDESHFSGRSSEPLQMTSPLQTFLDLMSMSGRGAEAAEPIFDKYLKQPMKAATEEARSFQ
ncbi:hypothetical protein Mal15_42300 [Stieleria maiorica]|uniref:Uncharacterized protein n=1 Tax=Stieleria maiorica TaxID=2795974 RepID=A0A5B9MJL2_9BACT|nr:type IV toxin-antitoxin system AbiEi family antitoxin [Stieleria maiorica]QEG00161.1 hypothetical protein Mal15_42300 [Stieleria maiorica]